MAYMRQGGLGDYEHTGNWAWEFYPPPYDFLASRDSAPMPAPVLFTPPASGSGLSGCGCGGTCGAGCNGLGLFDSGLDLSQWRMGEWVTAAGVGFLAVKVLGAALRTGRAVKRTVRKRSQLSDRRRTLLRELEDLK